MGDGGQVFRWTFCIPNLTLLGVEGSRSKDIRPACTVYSPRHPILKFPFCAFQGVITAIGAIGMRVHNLAELGVWELFRVIGYRETAGGGRVILMHQVAQRLSS